MESVKLTGMVLSATPVGDYDKRLVILTKERGKITAFAKGAKRTNSRFLAGSRPFSFGEFTVYAGSQAYHVEEMKISAYFDELSQDVYDTYYGFYFLEVAEYFTVEGIREIETLKLLYQSLRALVNKNIPNALIRCIFELRMLVIHGEYPDFFQCRHCGSSEYLTVFSQKMEGSVCKECEKIPTDRIFYGESVLYTLQYIVSSKLEKLYTFTVKDEVLKDLQRIIGRYFTEKVHKQWKTLEILNTLITT